MNFRMAFVEHAAGLFAEGVVEKEFVGGEFVGEEVVE